MELKKGYKKTEVGVIPDDWDAAEMQSVCKLINGRGFKPFEWKKDGYPIIRIQNLNGSEEFNYYQGSYDKKLEVERGQLLFAWSGSRGTSFGPHIWKGTKGLLNYHTWKVDVTSTRIDKDYFLHSLKELTKQIEDSAHGAAALVHVQKWEIEKLKFPIPQSKSEQTAIATALSDADALITSLEKLIVKKRNIKQGAMQQLLKPKKGWVVKRLGEIAEIKKGEQVNRDTLSENDTYPVMNGGISPSGYIGVWNANAGTIIISEGGNSCGFVNFIKTKFWQGGHCYSIVTNINSAFLFQLLKFREKAIMALRVGSGLPNIQRTRLFDFRISIPDTNSQTEIAKHLDDADTEIDLLEGRLLKFRLIKNGMMQNLLTGKIRLV